MDLEETAGKQVIHVNMVKVVQWYVMVSRLLSNADLSVFEATMVAALIVADANRDAIKTIEEGVKEENANATPNVDETFIPTDPKKVN